MSLIKKMKHPKTQKITTIVLLLTILTTLPKTGLSQYIKSNRYSIRSGPNDNSEIWVIQFEEKEDLENASRSDFQTYISNLLAKKDHPLVFQQDSNLTKAIESPKPVLNEQVFRRG